MGGRSSVKDELLCHFIFPERPGALSKFLDALSPRWNISLFHYRAQVLSYFFAFYSAFVMFQFCEREGVQF
jgi:C-terminal regulatory domain of Threonine dehydratase